MIIRYIQLLSIILFVLYSLYVFNVLGPISSVLLILLFMSVIFSLFKLYRRIIFFTILIVILLHLYLFYYYNFYVDIPGFLLLILCTFLMYISDILHGSEKIYGVQGKKIIVVTGLIILLAVFASIINLLIRYRITIYPTFLYSISILTILLIIVYMIRIFLGK